MHPDCLCRGIPDLMHAQKKGSAGLAFTQNEAEIRKETGNSSQRHGSEIQINSITNREGAGYGKKKDDRI
jgi:hypothetical protein